MSRQIHDAHDLAVVRPRGLRGLRIRCDLRRAARWLSWIVGAAVLAAVIVAALRSSKERELYRLTREARPAWLAARAAGAGVSRRTATWLSLGKLFVDQASCRVAWARSRPRRS
jgi:hypothetical protein